MYRVILVVSALFLASPASAATAFFKYERTTGMTKQCVYAYLGSEYTITISSVQLCPLTIQI